jgi:hypothetical protein
MEDKDSVLRENLSALLTGEHARMSFEDAVRDFPMDRINENFPNADYSPWHLLEHLRRAQEDILDYIINPDYQERQWPADYWPKKGAKATPADWRKSVSSFKKDFKALQDMVNDPKTDLFAETPQKQGITFIREIVTVSNHNAFHIGEFAMMRQAMGTWGKGH